MYDYKSSRTSTSKDEPVYQTKFRALFTLPAPLRNVYGTEILTEQLKKIDGLDTYRVPEAVEQEYRFVKRSFAGSTPNTVYELEMEFEVNVDTNGVQYPFNVFRDWSKIIYDKQSGFQALKKDYCGSVFIEMHRKDGLVLENWTFNTIFIMEPITPKTLEYVEDNLYKVTVKFRCDPDFDNQGY